MLARVEGCVLAGVHDSLDALVACLLILAVLLAIVFAGVFLAVQVG